MGYSMGARLTAFLALAHPQRVRSAIFGGLGGNMIRPMAGTGPIAHALEAGSIDEVVNPTARTFRAFAEKTGSDLAALAACIRGAREPISREMVAKICLPVSGRDRHRGRHRRRRRRTCRGHPRCPSLADPPP
jgi:pimeloyl-ACP methyl ester carboxylesterase